MMDQELARAVTAERVRACLDEMRGLLPYVSSLPAEEARRVRAASRAVARAMPRRK